MNKWREGFVFVVLFWWFVVVASGLWVFRNYLLLVGLTLVGFGLVVFCLVWWRFVWFGGVSSGLVFFFFCFYNTYISF